MDEIDDLRLQPQFTTDYTPHPPNLQMPAEKYEEEEFLAETSRREHLTQFIPDLVGLHLALLHREAQLCHVSQIDKWAEEYVNRFSLSNKQALDIAIKSHTLVSKEFQFFHNKIAEIIGRDPDLSEAFEAYKKNNPVPVFEGHKFKKKTKKWKILIKRLLRL